MRQGESGDEEEVNYIGRRGRNDGNEDEGRRYRQRRTRARPRRKKQKGRETGDKRERGL